MKTCYLKNFDTKSMKTAQDNSFHAGKTDIVFK